MAVKTFYALTTAPSSAPFAGSMADGAAPTTASAVYGYSIGTAAGPYMRSRLGDLVRTGVKSATSFLDAQTGPVAGTAAPDGTTVSTGDFFRTPAPLTGTFDAATAWAFNWVLRPVGTGGSGAIRMRVWASTNANGTGARELTSATLVGSTAAFSSTSADATSTISWSPGAITLANEYLFFELELQIVTTGSGNGSASVFRVGSAGSLVTTPDLSTGPAPATGTLSAQEDGSDTFAGTGTVGPAPVTGSAAARETGSDTFAAQGGASVSGSGAAQETGSDTFSATGGPKVAGTMGAQETGSDTFTASNGPPTGTMSAQETGSDTFTAAGGPKVAGTMGAQETGGDTFNAMAPAPAPVLQPMPMPQVFLPSPTERYDRAYMSRLLDTVRQNLDRRLSKETANESILLQSAAGKVFKVTVADDGTLTATYVGG